MISFIKITIGFIIFSGCLNSQLLTDINKLPDEKSICVKENEPLKLISNNSGSTSKAWFKIYPVCREYNNPVTGLPFAVKDIIYITEFIIYADTLILSNEQCGTFYYACFEIDPGKSIINDTIMTPGVLTEKLDASVQVIVRKDDTYLGYLSELLNTPFILAPQYTRNMEHQTDLRIGSDCAELAIYGKEGRALLTIILALKKFTVT